MGVRPSTPKSEGGCGPTRPPEITPMDIAHVLTVADKSETRDHSIKILQDCRTNLGLMSNVCDSST